MNASSVPSPERLVVLPELLPVNDISPPNSALKRTDVGGRDVCRHGPHSTSISATPHAAAHIHGSTRGQVPTPVRLDGSVRGSALTWPATAANASSISRRAS